METGHSFWNEDDTATFDKSVIGNASAAIKEALNMAKASSRATTSLAKGMRESFGGIRLKCIFRISIIWNLLFGVFSCN